MASDTFLHKILERYPHSKLCRERDSNRGAGAKEIAQPARGYFKLLEAVDGLGYRAICNRADVGHIAARDLVGGYRKRGHVGNEISAGVVAVEEVEELGERVNLPALANLDRAGDAHVHLDVGRSAEIVEPGRLAVHGNAPAAVLIGNGVRTGA